MIPELGHFALALALAVALAQTGCGMVGLSRDDARLMQATGPAAGTQLVLVALAFAALAYAHM